MPLLQTVNGILYTETLGLAGVGTWGVGSTGPYAAVDSFSNNPTAALYVYSPTSNSYYLNNTRTISGGATRHIRALVYPAPVSDAQPVYPAFAVGSWSPGNALQTTVAAQGAGFLWFDSGPIDPGQSGSVTVQLIANQSGSILGNCYWAQFLICASNLLTVNGLTAGQVVTAYRSGGTTLISTATCGVGASSAQIDLTNEAFPEGIYLQIYGTDGSTLIETTPAYTMSGGDQWTWQSPAPGLTATANAFIIYQNSGSAVITVTLLEANGTPYVGEPITFTTTLGTLTVASAATNSQGQASTTLQSSEFGIAVVQANWVGDSNIPAAEAYVTVHVFYGQETGNSNTPFQLFVEGYPLTLSAGTYTFNYRMVPGQFNIQIPAWDPNIVANGLVGFYRNGVLEYRGVLQRIERQLGTELVVTLSGVDASWLLNTRVIDSDFVTQMSPQAAISYLLTKYYCGITPGNLESYYPTQPAVGGGVIAAVPAPLPSIVQGPVRVTLANIPNPQSPENVLTVSLSTTPTVLDLLVLSSHASVFSGSTPSNIASITQTGVQWFRAAGPVNVSNGSESTEIWAGLVGPNAGTTITVTYGSSPNPVLAVVDVAEWNNLATTISPVVDQVGTQTASGGTTAGATGSTALTTFPIELVIGCVGATASSPGANQPAQPVGQSTPSSGFTLIDGNPLSVTYDVSDVGTETFSVSNAYLYQIANTSGAYSASTVIAGSAFMTGCIATFRAVAASYSPSVISQQFQTETLMAAIQQICNLVGWVYRVNPNLTLDFSAAFGRGAVPVSFVEGQNILTATTITDYFTEVNVLHVKGNGVNAIAEDKTSLAEVGLLESTDLQTSISDQTTLNLAAISALNSLQNAALITITLEGNDQGAAPGTFLPEDEVTLTSPTLGLSGGFQIAQITRNVANPAAYVSLQLNGLLREFLLLDQKYWSILHDFATGQGALAA